MKLTVKSTTDANINGSEAKKKQGLRYRMCQKSYLKTNGPRYVAKTESQQKAPYPHTAISHYMFPVRIGASRAIDKHFFNFSEGNIKQTQSHI